MHGSVKQTTTLIDTVSQKLRGLPPYVRYALAGLDRRFALLVIGFSGADLELGDDYLPLLCEGRHVTWIVNPDREPSPFVAAKLHEIGGVVVKARLPEIFAELDEAIALGTQAVEIYSRFGDPVGEALARATLAWCFLENEQAGPAFEHAERAMLFFEGQPVSPPKAMAAAVLALSHVLLGRPIEARPIARDAAQLIAACDAPSLRPPLRLLQRFLEPEPLPRAAEARAETSAVEAMMLDAERGNRTGDYERALELLANAEARPDATASERARIAGDRANVLQSAGRDLEAAAAYQTAAALLRAVGLVKAAQEALCQGAVSLRHAGQFAKAEEWLRALIAEPAVGGVAAQARLALINVLIHLRIAGNQRPLSEIETLLRDTFAQPLDDGNLAQALLASAQIHLLAGRRSEAQRQLELARGAFIRVNSPYVELVEEQLAKLREILTQRA